VWAWAAFLSDRLLVNAQALLLDRLAFAALAITVASLVYFALVFPSRCDRIGSLWSAFLGVGVAIASVTAATPLVVGDVVFRSPGTDAVPGVGFVAYAAWLILGIAAFIFVLGRKYQVAVGRERSQLGYVLIGVALFAVLSSVSGLLLPMLAGQAELAALNTLTPLALSGFAAYAMIEHRFRDARVLAVRGALYSILFAVLVATHAGLARLMGSQHLASSGMGADAVLVVGGLLAVSTLHVSRRKLEMLADRVFYRQRFDQHVLLERLSEVLVGMADPVEIADATFRVLFEQLKSGMIVLIHEEAGELAVYGDGIASGDPALPELVTAIPDGDLVLVDELAAGSRLAVLLRERGIQVVAPLASATGSAAALLLGQKALGGAYVERDICFLYMVMPEIAKALGSAELFEQRNHRLHELTALKRLTSVLVEDVQLDSLLARALERVIEVAAADAGSIMLIDPSSHSLTVCASQGLAPEVAEHTRVALGEGIAGWVAQHRTSLLMMDNDGASFPSELRHHGMKSALSVPLVSKERIIGVLNISRSGSSAGFTQHDMNVITLFSAQLAVAVENAQLFHNLEGHTLGTITALAAAVEAKDPHTYGHSSEVTEAVVAIALEMELDAEQTEILRKAALLHDIGKIGINGAILNKTGPLDPDEFAAIRRHPVIAANILGSLDFLEEVVPLVLHHHERVDGRGYPDGIAGADVPLGARIISVADSYNAMISNRPYRRAMPRAQAIEELQRNAGSQFDADVVAAYMRVLGATCERERLAESA
jgi:putative nucleotidyltransferase with HDIG domain